MIQITIRDDDPIGQYIEARVAQTGRPAIEIAEEVIQEGFQGLVQSLYREFMLGQMSQGHMAEILGINQAQLIHLLEAMNLQVTNL